MQLMKAAFINDFGPPEAIAYGELPEPNVRRQDVLVKIKAVTVDPIDTYIRSGSYRTAITFPFIVGRDLTGTVVRTGEDVVNFRPGDVVWANNQGYAGRQGTFAEYCSVDESLLYHLPANIDPVPAVAVLHSGLTAVLGLQFKAHLRAGESVFVNGGDGNVGTAILQIAKAHGARVAVTAGNPEKAAWCRELGADVVIDYKIQNVRQSVRDFSAAGVDIYWDTTLKPDLVQAVDVTAQRGRIILIAGRSHESVLPAGPFYLKNLTLYGFTVTDATPAELSEYAREINRHLERGILNAKIACAMPLRDAAKAHRMVENGGLFGKVVLLPD